MRKKIVVALGGNALGSTVIEQLDLAAVAASSIVNLIETGHDIIVTHGNGPQVGMINKALNHSYGQGVIETEFPMAESSALSVGYIGYHLQNAIQNELRKRGIGKEVASIVTQVMVDPKDPGFMNPTKPIGEFLTKEKAETLERVTGYRYMEDAGRGYRRVIASPKPVEIIELESIRKLSDHSVVIACGGGGVPVIEENGRLVGAEAVIDKDLTSALLARSIDADVFIILTGVENVAINYNKPNMKNLEVITQEELMEYMAEGHFAAGSMLPKVQAAINFISNQKNKKAIITSLENSSRAIMENKGTIIISE